MYMMLTRLLSNRNECNNWSWICYIARKQHVNELEQGVVELTSPGHWEQVELPLTEKCAFLQGMGSLVPEGQ